MAFATLFILAPISLYLQLYVAGRTFVQAEWSSEFRWDVGPAILVDLKPSAFHSGLEVRATRVARPVEYLCRHVCMHFFKSSGSMLKAVSRTVFDP